MVGFTGDATPVAYDNIFYKYQCMTTTQASSQVLCDASLILYRITLITNMAGIYGQLFYKII